MLDDNDNKLDQGPDAPDSAPIQDSAPEPTTDSAPESATEAPDEQAAQVSTDEAAPKSEDQEASEALKAEDQEASESEDDEDDEDDEYSQGRLVNNTLYKSNIKNFAFCNSPARQTVIINGESYDFAYSMKKPKPPKKYFTLDEIKVTLVKSTIGRVPKHRRTIRSLGLRKVGSSAVHYAHPTILGMINQVSYLVKVEPYTRRENDGRPSLTQQDYKHTIV
jgi:large subunit ribosomal protein L30